MKINKKLSASGGQPSDPPPGALPLDPAGGSLSPDLPELVMPPLANPRSATDAANLAAIFC